MLTKIAISFAISILKKVLAVLKKKALETRSEFDDLAVQALEDVISLYESGQLGKSLSSR